MGQPALAVPSLGLAGSERGCETSPGQAPAWGCWSSAREPGMLSGGERGFSVLGLGALLVARLERSRSLAGGVAPSPPQPPGCAPCAFQQPCQLL